MKKIIQHQLLTFAIIAAIRAALIAFDKDPYETWGGYLHDMAFVGAALTAIGIIWITWAAVRNRTAKD